MKVADIWKDGQLTPPVQKGVHGESRRQYQRQRDTYNALSAALEQLENLQPGAAHKKADLIFTDAVISKLFEGLHTTSTSLYKLRSQHNFLVQWLEHGVRECHWQANIPSPMIIQSRKPPPVTTRTFQQLTEWDNVIELHDQYRLPPLPSCSQDQWLVGRFIFQLIREGALLNKAWLKQLPAAICSGIAFEQDSAYLTLKKNLRPEMSKEKRPAVSAPDDTPVEQEAFYQYRRLFLSPVSQLLLLGYYQQHGLHWPKTASAEVCLMHYVRHLFPKRKGGRMTELLTLAFTSASMELTPLLIQFASQQDMAASLCPSTWRRLTRGSVLSGAPQHKEDDDAMELAFNPLPSPGAHCPDQLKRFRQLQACVSAKKSTKTTRKKALARIDQLLATPEENGIMLTLLANWCKSLISRGGRVKSSLAISSVSTYLSAIGRSLIAHEHMIDRLGTDTASDWEKLYAHVLEGAQTTSRRITRQYRLNDFHHFISRHYAIPDIEFETPGRPLRRVDVNIVTPAEFRRALALIDTSNQPEEFRKMQALGLILGYRLGLRRNECASLLMRDVATLEHSDVIFGEIIVRANKFHDGKSASATRRLPLWLLMPQEQERLIEWVKQKRAAATTKAVSHQPLFHRPDLDHLPLGDAELFRPIQVALKTATGDEHVRYHHLRHSFVTLTLLRLMEGSPMALIPDAWQRDDSGDIALPNATSDVSNRAGLAPQDTPTRKRLWQLALWAGHASPKETLRSYTHLLDWILGCTLKDHANPALSNDQQQRLLNMPSETALTSWHNRRGLTGELRAGELLPCLTKQWNDFTSSDPLAIYARPYQKPNINPLDGMTSTASPWPDAIRIYQCLRLVEQQEGNGLSLDEAISRTAERVAMQPEELRHWMVHGEALMQRQTRRQTPRFSRLHVIDRNMHKDTTGIYLPELKRCMAPPIKPAVLKEAGQFYHHLLNWHQSQPDTAEAHLLTLKRHMQRSTGQIELPDADAINHVREILRPLRCFQHVYLVVEVEAAAKEKSIKAHWSKATNIPHQRIELKPTPTPSGRTRHWYGNANLKITRGHYSEPQQPLWEAVRFAAFMVMLVLGLTEDT